MRNAGGRNRPVRPGVCFLPACHAPARVFHPARLRGRGNLQALRGAAGGYRQLRCARGFHRLAEQSAARPARRQAAGARRGGSSDRPGCAVAGCGPGGAGGGLRVGHPCHLLRREQFHQPGKRRAQEHLGLHEGRVHGLSRALPDADGPVLRRGFSRGACTGEGRHRDPLAGQLPDVQEGAGRPPRAVAVRLRHPVRPCLAAGLWQRVLGRTQARQSGSSASSTSPRSSTRTSSGGQGCTSAPTRSGWGWPVLPRTRPRSRFERPRAGWRSPPANTIGARAFRRFLPGGSRMRIPVFRCFSSRPSHPIAPTRREAALRKSGAPLRTPWRCTRMTRRNGGSLTGRW